MVIDPARGEVVVSCDPVADPSWGGRPRPERKTYHHRENPLGRLSSHL